MQCINAINGNESGNVNAIKIRVADDGGGYSIKSY